MHEDDRDAFFASFHVVDFIRSTTFFSPFPIPFVPALLSQLQSLTSFGVYFKLDCRL
jgi:hypothetical protein